MNPAARAQRRADGKQAARAQPKQHGAPCRDFDSRPPVHACTIVRGAANGHELRATRVPIAPGCRGNWRRGELVHGHGATPPVSATARRVFGGLGRAKRCCPCSRFIDSAAATGQENLSRCQKRSPGIREAGFLGDRGRAGHLLVGERWIVCRVELLSRQDPDVCRGGSDAERRPSRKKRALCERPFAR